MGPFRETLVEVWKRHSPVSIALDLLSLLPLFGFAGCHVDYHTRRSMLFASARYEVVDLGSELDQLG